MQKIPTIMASLAAIGLATAAAAQSTGAPDPNGLPGGRIVGGSGSTAGGAGSMNGGPGAMNNGPDSMHGGAANSDMAGSSTSGRDAGSTDMMHPTAHHGAKHLKKAKSTSATTSGSTMASPGQ